MIIEDIMAKLTPIEDHVLIEPINEENTTASGIVLPDSKEKTSKGKVIRVGAGKVLENGSRSSMDVKEWDTVYFTKYSPDELEVEGKKYLVIRHNALLAVEK